MTYKDLFEQLIFELKAIEHNLWVSPSERFNAGVAENMVYDKQNEVSDEIGDLIARYIEKIDEVDDGA